jgi:hypothetical protein
MPRLLLHISSLAAVGMAAVVSFSGGTPALAGPRPTTKIAGQYCLDKSSGRVFVAAGVDTTGLYCPPAVPPAFTPSPADLMVPPYVSPTSDPAPQDLAAQGGDQSPAPSLALPEAPPNLGAQTVETTSSSQVQPETPSLPSSNDSGG